MASDPASDDLDPTAPPNWFEADHFVEAVDGEDIDQEVTWQLSDGFTDDTGTVRLWTDPFGAPQRIVLARYWRDQMKQVSLEEMFADVFLQAAVLLTARPAPLPEARPVESDEQLSSELLERMMSRMAELDSRIAELDEADDGYSMWSGETAVGTAEEGRVRLTLNIVGAPQTVSFDPRWLAEASMGQVSQAVLVAYADARANFTEPVHTPGERAEVAADYLTLAATIEQAAARGLPGLRPIDPDEVPTPDRPASQEENS